jgi:hypothetical protein
VQMDMLQKDDRLWTLNAKVNKLKASRLCYRTRYCLRAQFLREHSNSIPFAKGPDPCANSHEEEDQEGKPQPRGTVPDMAMDCMTGNRRRDIESSPRYPDGCRLSAYSLLSFSVTGSQLLRNFLSLPSDGILHADFAACSHMRQSLRKFESSDAILVFFRKCCLSEVIQVALFR